MTESNTPAVGESVIQDARRYRRLRVLGCAVDEKHLDSGTVQRFSNLDKAVDDDLRVYGSRGEEKIEPIAAASLLRAEGAEEFKPCVSVNDEMNLTEIVIEDVPFVAKPLFDGVHHWMDKHCAMYDGRLVGFTVWMTKPPARPASGDAGKMREALKPFADEFARFKHLSPGPSIDHWPLTGDAVPCKLRLGDLRHAAEALALPASGGQENKKDHETTNN